MGKTYHIIEIANTHGGNLDYLLELIDYFADLKENFGMKFQAFYPDKIATKNFSAYGIYEELCFEKSEWQQVIKKAAATKDVWLDVFDLYGAEVLHENIELIYGIKFQSSVLYNYEVFNALAKSNFKGRKIILNVAAQPLEDIRAIIENVQQKLNPSEVLLEFGYQAYPTSLQDSGLSKIELIRQNFSNRLVFADHVDGKTDDAIWLPVVAALSGVDYIEKHVMLADKETKYDHFSSLTPERYRKMINEVERYTALKLMPFINQKEQQYLENTIMIPLLKNDLSKGSGIALDKDFIYRRSGKAGLNVKQVQALQANWHLPAVNKKEGDALQHSDFKKATVATIIACRLKSSRLPQKALLKIGSLTSVEYCISSALKFENINYTILATSDLVQDDPLKDYTYNEGVIFHRGHPDDVIQRYLDVAVPLKIDVIVRVTADNPFIDGEICQLLLNEHFKSGADYTTAKDAAVGTNLEIINVQALKKVKEHFPSANYSEYMTWYFQNNPEHFKLHFVNLPEGLVRNYRLTLDHQEDLDMYNAIDKHFREKSPKQFTLRDIYKYLDDNADVASMNQHISITYKTDAALIDLLNTHTKIK